VRTTGKRVNMKDGGGKGKSEEVRSREPRAERAEKERKRRESGRR
jgi:hypothetical protein